MEVDIKRPYTYLDAIAGQLRAQYEGHTYAQVAELTGVSKSMVELILGPRMQNFTMDTLIRLVRPLGLDITSFFEAIEYPDEEEVIPKNVPRYTKAVKKEACYLVRKKGATHAQAANYAGCSPSTISRWLKESS